MGLVQAVVGSMITLIFYGVVAIAVWKLFQIASDLGEVKELLSDIRRNLISLPPNPAGPIEPAPVPISLASAEALLREVAEGAEQPESTV